MSGDAIDTALAQLTSAGLLVDLLQVDGRLHRVEIDGVRKGKKAGWYICNWFRLDNGEQVVVGSYGIWVGDDPGATKLEFERGRGFSQAEHERLRDEQKRLAELQQQDREAQRAEAARRAEALFASLPDHGAVPYLQRKQVRMFGCRIGRNGVLVVPLRRPFSAALVGLQFIHADGSKKFITGTAKTGAAHLIGELADSPTVVLAEGYATAASVHQATGWPAFVCFDCGNLLPVARQVREAMPKIRIIVAADHDQWTVRGEIRRAELRDIDPAAIAGDDARWADWRGRGWLVNAGRDAAFEVLSECRASVAMPPFAADDPVKRTDFNDLHVSENLDAVRACFFTPGALITTRPVEVIPPPEPEPAPEPVALTTLADVLARFELVHGSTDAWDVQLGLRMTFGALSALVGDALAKAWKADTTKRVKIIPGAAKKAPAPAPEAAPDDDEDQDERPQWKRQLVYGENGLKGSMWNVMHILRNDPRWVGVFGFDAFAKRIVKLKPPPFGGSIGLLTDTDETEAGAWFGRKDTYRCEVKTSIAREAITVVASGNSFHPVRDYLTSLSWDGEPRIDHFFSDFCGAAQSTMHAKFASNFFIQAVARIFRPGCKADLMLVLEGTQGARKSTLAETLAGGFYADVGTGPSDKDFYQIIQGCWLVEISELASFARAETSHIKRAISVATDRFRRAYGHNVEEFKRECVFFGTVNNSEWQRDETGGRRFMPIWVSDVNIDAVRAVRDQLWAEAVHRFKAGETWHELPPEAREAQESRYTPDVWTPRIVRWLDGRAHASRYKTNIPAKIQTTTVGEILSRVIELPLGKQGKSEQTRVGTIMTRLGWKKRETKIGGEHLRWYDRPADQAGAEVTLPDEELETQSDEGGA